MRKTIQNNLIKTDRVAKIVLEISAGVMFAFLLLWLVYALVFNNLVNVPSQTTRVITSAGKTIVIIVLCVFLLSVVMRIIISPFVKSDEETEFEARVNYILGKKPALRKQPKGNEVFTPLVNLTQEQEDAICKLLKELPSNINKPNQINMAAVSQFLTALHRLDYLNDTNLNNLYNWVGSVTGKEMPSYNHFNEAYPSDTVRKVDKAKDKILTALQKIR
ncbi:MAG: hypothetical protein IJ776_05550 [Paludibacteraceae bacterium]|nr:hypothetical protein [Paludibacteraceae bacterium]